MLNFITWDVSPEIFTLGPITMRWYGLLFVMGFILGQPILKHIYKTDGRKEEDVDVITMYMIIGTVIGARLGHCLFYDPDYYLSHPLEILMVWKGGLASHGATLGILLALYLFCRNHKFNYLWVLDRIVIVVALGGAFIRLGNLMNSEIIGRPADVPWAFKFVRNAERFNGVPANLDPRHPTQLYESFFCIFLFILLYRLWKQGKGQIRGFLFGLFVTLLFTFRFVVEFFKENQEDFENNLPLNMGQWLSIPLVLIGIGVLVYALKQPRQPKMVA